MHVHNVSSLPVPQTQRCTKLNNKPYQSNLPLFGESQHYQTMTTCTYQRCKRKSCNEINSNTKSLISHVKHASMLINKYHYSLRSTPNLVSREKFSNILTNNTFSLHIIYKNTYPPPPKKIPTKCSCQSTCPSIGQPTHFWTDYGVCRF